MSSFFFFKQKTANEMLISDWSSDVCSSALAFRDTLAARPEPGSGAVLVRIAASGVNPLDLKIRAGSASHAAHPLPNILGIDMAGTVEAVGRSEEHTSELQSLMRISYAVFCLKKKNNPTRIRFHRTPQK